MPDAPLIIAAWGGTPPRYATGVIPVRRSFAENVIYTSCVN